MSFYIVKSKSDRSVFLITVSMKVRGPNNEKGQAPTKCQTTIFGAEIIFLYLTLHISVVSDQRQHLKKGAIRASRGTNRCRCWWPLCCHRMRAAASAAAWHCTTRRRGLKSIQVFSMQFTSKIYSKSSLPYHHHRASLFPSATTTSHQPVARRFRVLCACIAILKVNSHLPCYYTLNVCWAANIRHLSQFQHCY